MPDSLSVGEPQLSIPCLSAYRLPQCRLGNAELGSQSVLGFAGRIPVTSLRNDLRHELRVVMRRPALSSCITVNQYGSGQPVPCLASDGVTQCWPGNPKLSRQYSLRFTRQVPPAAFRYDLCRKPGTSYLLAQQPCSVSHHVSTVFLPGSPGQVGKPIIQGQPGAVPGLLTTWPRAGEGFEHEMSHQPGFPGIAIPVKNHGSFRTADARLQYPSSQQAQPVPDSRVTIQAPHPAKIRYLVPSFIADDWPPCLLIFHDSKDIGRCQIP